MSKDSVLITGAAGFIGFALAHRLLKRGGAVVGLDNVNDYPSIMCGGAGTTWPASWTNNQYRFLSRTLARDRSRSRYAARFRSRHPRRRGLRYQTLLVVYGLRSFLVILRARTISLPATLRWLAVR